MHVSDTIHDRYMGTVPKTRDKIAAITINSSKKETRESVETNRIYNWI